MEIVVQKRSGAYVDFEPLKIKKAIENAFKDCHILPNQHADTSVETLAEAVVSTIYESPVNHTDEAGSVIILSVDDIDNIVETVMFEADELEMAKHYILYRHIRKPDMYRKRLEVLPFEYPEFLEFIDAIRRCYWVHTEFNFEADAHDIKHRMPRPMATASKRSLLAVAQVEVGVKSFWKKVGDVLPKPEIDLVGVTFGESEVRHFDAYKHLLEVLHLEEMFKEIHKIPAINKRVKYLDNMLVRNHTKQEYFQNIILFSMFIENVSLFSQFFVLMAINKNTEERFLQNVSNVVEATSKEEDIHARFGFALIHQLRSENPTWWDNGLKEQIIKKAKVAVEAEDDIIDWIFEDGELEECPIALVKDFMRHRMNISMEAIGIEKMYEIPLESYKQFEWFEVELVTTKSFDRFAKRGNGYNKKAHAISGDDL